MSGAFQYIISLVGFLAEIAVVVCVCKPKNFRRYLPLGFYMLCGAVATCALYFSLVKFGSSSATYRFLYFYSDSTMMLAVYWVIIRFYLQVFQEMGISGYIRRAAVVLLGCTALFSYGVVHENRYHLTIQFAVELCQNLYFVGVVLIYLLWGAVVKLKETRSRLAQFVLALGIYFSATAAAYALRTLFHGLEDNLILMWIPSVMGLWLPVAWTYTFVKVPEESRVVPALLEAKAAA
ncbi:MAG TPA: hypothetical protein VN727_03855 [Candidatus Binatia bacterium]|nr:hypothetical protein [Candidatus Binatia bacterium]